MMTKSNKQQFFRLMEAINPDFRQLKPKLIIPVGISGSGKSTWIKSIENQGYEVVSPDEIRLELTGDMSDQSKNKEVFATAYQKTADILNSNKNVIFDATNIESFLRKDLLNFLKQNVNTEFDAIAKIFNANPDISKERIKRDIDSGINRANVSPESIDVQYQKFINDLNKVESDGYKIIK